VTPLFSLEPMIHSPHGCTGYLELMDAEYFCKPSNACCFVWEIQHIGWLQNR